MVEVVEYVGNGVEHTLRIDSAQFDAHIVEMDAVGVPRAGHDVVSIAGLEFHCLVAGTLVDLQTTIIGDVAEYIVTRDGSLQSCFVARMPRIPASSILIPPS